jgi:hypothetical protein
MYIDLSVRVDYGFVMLRSGRCDSGVLPEFPLLHSCVCLRPVDTRVKEPLTPALSRREREPTEVSCVLHRPERPR